MVVLDDISGDEKPARVTFADPSSAAPRLVPGVDDLDAADEISDATRVEGNARYKQKDFEAAEALYTLALSQANPIGELVPAILGNRSAARLALNRLDDALADAEEMVCQCHDGHVMAGKALYRKGNVLAAMGRTKEARRVYQNSLNITPDEKAQRPILAKLVEVTNAAVEEKQTEEVRAELHKQREMIRESRELKDLMGLDPKTADKPPKERYHMATKALKDGDVSRALRLYSSVYPTDLEVGKVPQYWGNRSHAALKFEDYGHAVECAEECVKADPGYAKGRYRLGEALLKMAQKSEGVDTAILERWVRRSIDEGFKEASRLNPDSAEEARAHISDGEVYLQELAVRVKQMEKAETKADVEAEKESLAKGGSDIDKGGSDAGSADSNSDSWVEVPSPGYLAPKIVSFDAITCDDATHPERIAFIDAMKEHGCVCVRLPKELSSPHNVFVEAGACAAAFFKLKHGMKAKHKPVGAHEPPAQSGYHTETGFHHPRDARSKALRGHASCLKKDEEDLECFVVENEFEADFPWPNVKFKERLLDAHITARLAASKFGDILMTAAGVSVMDPGFDEKAEKCGLRAMTCRTTFAAHPSKIDINGGANVAATLECQAQMAHSINAGTTEPTLVSVIPRVDDPSRGRMHAQVYMDLPTTVAGKKQFAKMRWPAFEGQEEELRDCVLVVAGEYLNQITDGVYPAPRVGHVRRCDCAGDVVRAVYRA